MNVGFTISSLKIHYRPFLAGIWGIMMFFINLRSKSAAQEWAIDSSILWFSSQPSTVLWVWWPLSRQEWEELWHNGVLSLRMMLTLLFLHVESWYALKYLKDLGIKSNTQRDSNECQAKKGLNTLQVFYKDRARALEDKKASLDLWFILILGNIMGMH